MGRAGATEFSCLCERSEQHHEDGGSFLDAVRVANVRGKLSPTALRLRTLPGRPRADRPAHRPPTALPRHDAGNFNSHEEPLGQMIDRQHVWVGPEATSFEVPCEACLARARRPTRHLRLVARRTPSAHRGNDQAGRRRRLHDLPPRPPDRRPSRRPAARRTPLTFQPWSRSTRCGRWRCSSRSYEAFVRGRVKFRVGQDRLPRVLEGRNGNGLRLPEGVAGSARRDGAGEILAAERARHALPLGSRRPHGNRRRRDARPRHENAWALCVPRFVYEEYAAERGYPVGR